MAVKFNLKNYDLFSFDLDNTLCEYNVGRYTEGQYKFLTDCLSRSQGFEQIDTQLNDDDIKFVSKGLFIDVEKGNLLKLSHDGIIERVSHGKDMLTKEAIAAIYGTNRKWDKISEYLKVPHELALLKRAHTIPIMDINSSILSVTYAKAVAAVDPAKISLAQVWKELRTAINTMYETDSFWWRDFTRNLNAYTLKADLDVRKWLGMLKSHSHTSLITASDPLIAELVASHSLGSNWKDLFHLIIYSSQKPQFFYEDIPFYSNNACRIRRNDFTFFGEFRRGSFDQVREFLAKKLGREPKSIYFGDNPLCDLIRAPEAVAIIREVGAEGLVKTYKSDLHDKYLTSTQWGSLFYENVKPTFFGKIVMNTAFCAPNVSFFTKNPINFEYVPFWNRGNISK